MATLNSVQLSVLKLIADKKRDQYLSLQGIVDKVYADNYKGDKDVSRQDVENSVLFLKDNGFVREVRPHIFLVTDNGNDELK